MEKGASERFDEISIEGRDSIRREGLLKYISSNVEGLSLRNIESLQKIILSIQEESIKKSYLGKIKIKVKI